MACYPERRKGRLTGVWIAETVLHGSVVRKRFNTHKEGQQWADLVKATGFLPAAVEKPKGAPTFREVAERCKEAKDTWREGRDPRLPQRLATVVDLIGDLPIDQVTAEALEHLKARLRKRKVAGHPLSLATVNRYLMCASGVLHYAKSVGLIAGTPTVPLAKESEGRLHWITAEEEAAICAELEARGWHHEALVVKVLGATGMRWGELASLDVGQIAEEDIHLWRTKNDTPRSLYIPQVLSRQLRELVASGNVPKYKLMRNRFRKACKSAGVSDEVTLHSLRHSTASRLVQLGTDIRVIQTILGHNDIATTMRYAHVKRETVHNAMKKLTPLAGETEQKLEKLS